MSHQRTITPFICPSVGYGGDEWANSADKQIWEELVEKSSHFRTWSADGKSWNFFRAALLQRVQKINGNVESLKKQIKKLER